MSELTYASTSQTAVYRCFDGEGRMLYVGVTQDFPSRWTKHRADSPWWADMEEALIEWHDSRAAALNAEARAIREESPLHNKRQERESAPGQPNSPAEAPRPLAGVAEVAELIGATRQYVWQLSKRRDFPEPAYVLTAGHFWWLDDIEAWAARKGIDLSR